MIRYFCSSIPSRHLHLSTSIFSTPSSTDGLTPLDTSICRELLRIYIFVLRDSVLYSSISLDLSAPASPKLYLSHSKPLPQCFFQSFTSFPSLGKLLIFHSLCISCFETYVLGFLKILGFFKINECLLKFWDFFLLK